MARLGFNWRFLLVTTTGLLVALVGLYVVHKFQVRKQADAFLRQADAARDASPPDKPREMQYLRRYLASRPSEIEPRDRLARRMAETAANPIEAEDAYFAIEEVLRRDPDRDSLRRVSVDLAMNRLRRFPEARAHLELLLKKSPNDPDLVERYAECHFVEKQYQRSADLYQQLADLKPDLLVAYTSKALILRAHLDQPVEADKAITAMVAKNPKVARAYVIQAGYLRANGTPAQEDAAVAKARELAPDDVDVILLVANVAIERARTARNRGEPKAAEIVKAKWAEAEAELDRGAKLHPKEVGITLARAGLVAETRTAADAVAIVRAALKDAPESVPLLEALVDYLLLTSDATGAATAIEQLAKLGVPPAGLAYNRARLLVARQEWLTAVAALEAVRRDAGKDVVLARKASLLQGRCYEQIGETDRRLAAFNRAIPDDFRDPLWAAAMTGVADSYAAMGRPDDALKTYQRMADATAGGYYVVPGALIKVAQFRTLTALRTSDPKAIDWAPAEQAVALAEKVFPDNTDVRLLRADLHVFRNRSDEANTIINDLFANRPKEAAVWQAKASQQLREVSQASAVAVLEKGRAELGDPVDLRLAQARLWADPKYADAAAKLAALADGAEKYTAVERRTLYRGLAEVATIAGQGALAGRFWDQVVSVQRDDLSAHIVLFDRALEANDEPAMGRIQDAIRRLDGPDGTTTLNTRAQYLIWKATQTPDRPGLTEALELLDRVERDRPGWSRVSLARALIYDLQNRPDLAITQYREAVERKEYNPDVLRRLTALLAAKGQFAEANAILEKLPDLSAGGPAAQRLAAEVSLRTENPRRALDLASKAVPADSTSADDQVWLGRVLYHGGDRRAAEKPFRRAVELKPDDPQALAMLVEYLVDSNRVADAKALIEQQKGKLRADDRSLALARCYTVVGMLPEAEAAIRSAVRDRPTDTGTLIAEANFLTNRGRWADARAAWERVIGASKASAEEKEYARGMLGICLSVDPDPATARRAIAYLGMDAGGALTARKAETADQRRARAIVLSLQRDRPSKLAAIRLLDADRDALVPADRFLLVQMQAQVGDRTAVRLGMTDLLRRSSRDTLYIAFYAEWLLQQGELKEAEPLVAKLEAQEPEAARTVAMKARLLGGKKDLPAARALLNAQVQRTPALVGAIAALAEEIGLHAEAEDYYKKFVGVNEAKQPEVAFALAKFYARRERLDDALNVCEAAWPKCPPQLAGKESIEVLEGATTRTPQQVARVEGWLAAALGKASSPTTALRSLSAYLKSVQGDHDQAVRIFRELAGGSNPDPTILNNLAYLLSAHLKQHQEALALLDRAKAAVGPVPSLIDTEALVRMALGGDAELATARRLLEDVVALEPSGTSYYHLALLEQQCGNLLERDAAVREAVKRKLTAADLHPLEQPAWREMQKKTPK